MHGAPGSPVRQTAATPARIHRSGRNTGSADHDVRSRRLAPLRDPRSRMNGDETSPLIPGSSKDGVLQGFEQGPEHALETGLRRPDPRDMTWGENELHFELAGDRHPGLSERGVDHARNPGFLGVGWARHREVHECRGGAGHGSTGLLHAGELLALSTDGRDGVAPRPRTSPVRHGASEPTSVDPGTTVTAILLRPIVLASRPGVDRTTIARAVAEELDADEPDRPSLRASVRAGNPYETSCLTGPRIGQLKSDAPQSCTQLSATKAALRVH